MLVNARDVKNVPGRKTDVSDAQWLCQLIEAGLLRSSFVPPKSQRQLRALTRYRKTQIAERQREANRLHKALEDTGIKLGNVAIRGLSRGHPPLKRPRPRFPQAHPTDRWIRAQPPRTDVETRPSQRDPRDRLRPRRPQTTSSATSPQRRARRADAHAVRARQPAWDLRLQHRSSRRRAAPAPRGMSSTNGLRRFRPPVRQSLPTLTVGFRRLVVGTPVVA